MWAAFPLRKFFKESLTHGSLNLCVNEKTMRVNDSPYFQFWSHTVPPPIPTRNVLDCNQSNYSSRIIFSCTFALGWNQIRIRPDEPFQIYGHSKLCNTADGDLGFGPTGNSEIRSDDLENPTPESNTKWIGWPAPKIWPFEIFASWILWNRK